jgi:hypothetical protein
MGPLLARTLTSRPRARASSRESSFRFIVRQRHVIIGKRKVRRIRRLEILWLDAGLRTGKGAILIRERTKAPRCREAPWQIRRKVSLITLYPGPEGIAVSTVTLKANGRKFVWFCGSWMGGVIGGGKGVFRYKSIRAATRPRQGSSEDGRLGTCARPVAGSLRVLIFAVAGASEGYAILEPAIQEVPQSSE